MYRMRMYLLVAITGMLTAIGCKSKPDIEPTAAATNSMPIAAAYKSIGSTGCRDSVGINGTWRLVKVHGDGQYPAFDANETAEIKDCSTVTYYSSGTFLKKDNFKLYRVLSYCADYQLDYMGKNDSVSCVNMFKDTLIFGDCSTFESIRYYYKRVK